MGRIVTNDRDVLVDALADLIFYRSNKNISIAFELGFLDNIQSMAKKDFDHIS